MTRIRHCIVHAGTHKTGTTTAQEVLASHRADLAAAGILYPAIDRKGRDHNALVHRLATCADGDLVSARDELVRGSARIDTRQEGAATLLLSAEEISTRICNPDPWAGFDDGTYWDHRRRFLTRLQNVLPEGASVETFVCFRDHESYAHSLYATKVLSGKIDGSFSEFVEHCAPIFDYRRQAEVLAEAFGPVRVASYEELRGDLANRLFAWLGVPIRVEHTPRLKTTPTLDLIHWLADTTRSPAGRDDRKLRAEFCRAYEPKPEGTGLSVGSLWQSVQARSDFLRRCQPPPMECWPPPAMSGHIADRAALDRRAEEIEAEYRQWQGRYGGHRKHWMYFWRRL